jgi:hypothetical protein
MLNFENKQHISDLLKYMYADNATDIVLPPSDGRKNSDGDNGNYAPSWYEEYFEERENHPENTISIELDGVGLYAYKFTLDGVKVALISMEYEDAGPRGCALVVDYGIDTQCNLVAEWLGNSRLDEYEPYEDIHEFSRLVGYSDGSES